MVVAVGVAVVAVPRVGISVATAEHPVWIESCRCPARPPGVRRRAAYRHHLGWGQGAGVWVRYSVRVRQGQSANLNPGFTVRTR